MMITMITMTMMIVMIMMITMITMTKQRHFNIMISVVGSSPKAAHWVWRRLERMLLTTNGDDNIKTMTIIIIVTMFMMIMMMMDFKVFVGVLSFIKRVL